MKIMNVFFIIVVLVLHTNICIAARTDITDIVPYLSTQEETNWCWAAVDKSILKYYGYSLKQCDLVDVAFGFPGSKSSCDKPYDGGYAEDSPYNQALSPSDSQKVLARWGVSSTVTGSYLQQSECVTEITNRRPFYISKKWGTPSNVQGGHALLGYGYDGMYIDYWDPAFPENGGGAKQVSYTSLVSNPTAKPPYFWGNAVKNIKKSSGADTWYVADIHPPNGTSDGWAYIGGYVNSTSSFISFSEVSFGTTTSYEKGTLVFNSTFYPETPRPAWAGYVLIPIPSNAANTAYHFRVRTRDVYNNTLYMTSDQTFLVPPSYQTYPLTISKTGTGTVISTSPSSPTINCGSMCSASYPQNTSVKLSATPAPTSWTGCDSIIGSSCTVNMSTARSVIASFPIRVDGVCGSGNGQTFTSPPPAAILCSTGSASAISTTGSSWTWTCQGTNGGNTASCLTHIAQVSLYVSKAGSGTGSVTISPGTIGWFPDTKGTNPPLTGFGIATYNVYTLVTLTATPDPGNIFTGWTLVGNSCPGKGPCQIYMNSGRNVTATFVPITQK